MKSNGRSSILRQLLSRVTRDIGIDLGTANTLVHVADRGIVLREPSVVAINKDTGEVLAVGEEAKRMLGRTPASIVAIRPLKDGVIADYDQTEKMLRYFISKVTRRSLVWQTVVVGIPSGVTEVERRAVIEATERAGASRAYVIEEPMAAAIGAGLPIEEPIGSMIVDIGGGTTEVAVISLAGIVHSKSIRIAGDEIDEAIAAYIRRAYNLFIGDRTAEIVKIEIGSAFPLETEFELTVKGRDLVSPPQERGHHQRGGSDGDRGAAQRDRRGRQADARIDPPELASDAMNHGIVLAGGGALIRGIDKLISQETGMPVLIAEDPLGCVAFGTGKVVEAMHENPAIRKMLEKSSKR